MATPPTIPLSALAGTIELPTGVDFKVTGSELVENFRVKDGEGLADQGYSVPVMTGRSLTGKITGYMTANEAGIADPNAITAFNDAPFTITFGPSQTVSGNCCVTRFTTVCKVGEIITFECDFESIGAYTSEWPAS
jgi:hypothetical protein